MEVADFVSTTIIERLQEQAGILKPKIEDWRAMVDCVMIDPAYDPAIGIFNITLLAMPEKKSDLVSDRYELPIPKPRPPLPSRSLTCVVRRS